MYTFLRPKQSTKGSCIPKYNAKEYSTSNSCYKEIVAMQYIETRSWYLGTYTLLERKSYVLTEGLMYKFR